MHVKRKSQELRAEICVLPVTLRDVWSVAMIGNDEWLK